MNRRWLALTAAAVLVAPLVTACGDDGDGPSDPTVTLFEGTPSPNVSTDVST